MSERHLGDHAGTGSVGFSQGSSWRERRQKEQEDRGHDQQEVMSDIGKGSYQTQRTVSGATGQRQKEERDKELEWLRRLVVNQEASRRLRQLMRRIEEYKRLEDDRLQSKGQVPMMNRPRQTGFPFRPRRGLAIQEPAAQMGEVNVMFKELVHRILDRIKHEPYF